MLNAQLRSVWGHTADLTAVGFGQTHVFVALVFGSNYRPRTIFSTFSQT